MSVYGGEPGPSELLRACDCRARATALVRAVAEAEDALARSHNVAGDVAAEGYVASGHPKVTGKRPLNELSSGFITGIASSVVRERQRSQLGLEPT